MLFLFETLFFALIAFAVFWLFPPVRRAAPLKRSIRRALLANALIGPAAAALVAAMLTWGTAFRLPQSVHWSYFALIAAAPVMTGFGLALGWAMLRLRFRWPGLIVSTAWLWYTCGYFAVFLVLMKIYPQPWIAP